MKVCVWEGCDRKSVARNLCDKHHNQAKKLGIFESFPLMRPKRSCLIEGCLKNHYSEGYCPMHFHRLKNGLDMFAPPKEAKTECMVDGCEREHKALGFCAAHYIRFKNDLDMNAPFKNDPNRNRTCTIQGCDRIIECKGLCSWHYARMKNGIPFDMPFKKRYYSDVCEIEGCESPRKNHGLCAMHTRRKQKGQQLGGPRKKKKYNGELCFVVDCIEKAKSRGMCQFHYVRSLNGVHLQKIKQGTKLPDLIPLEMIDKLHWAVCAGYLICQRDGKRILQHRAIWEAHNGRKLQKFENIHHINGIRTDNRIENLELWTKPQPCGQRPEDLVAWVIEHYREEVLRAIDTRLELDLQPEGSNLES